MGESQGGHRVRGEEMGDEGKLGGTDECGGSTGIGVLRGGGCWKPGPPGGLNMWTSRGEHSSWGRQTLHMSGVEMGGVVMVREQVLEVEEAPLVAGD